MQMKKLKVIITALSLIALAGACKTEGKRITTITEDDNNTVLKIQYSGRALFSDDKTAILAITPNGYVKYTKNDQTLLAENDGKGNVLYQINGGIKQKELSNSDKLFLAQAVKDMAKHGHNDGK
jgi:hypothetical protein